MIEGCIVTTNDLVLTCLLANLVITNAESHHVNAHVGRRLVGAGAVYAFEEGVQDREDLYITVVIDGNLIVCIHVEGIDHVHVTQVCRRCLVSYVDRMLEWKVPHREGLKLGITSLVASFTLLVELTQADCHLAAARSGSCHDNQRTRCLDVIVPAETFVGVYQLDVVGVTLDVVMVISTYSEVFQTTSIDGSTALTIVMSNHHAVHHKASLLELRPESQHIFIVRDAQVLTDLVLFNVECTDDNHYLGTGAELLEHSQLAVGLESGQHSAGMKVVEKFAAKLKV